MAGLVPAIYAVLQAATFDCFVAWLAQGFVDA